MQGRVLLAEDDAELRETLALDLRQRGLDVDAFATGDEANVALGRGPYDVVLTDLRMPGLSGLALCERVAANQPEVPVIVLTSFGSYDSAVGALRAGAFDFISKPVDFELLAAQLERALRHRALKRDVRVLSKAVEQTERFDELLGRSPPMLDLYRLLDRAAATDAPVLLSGESGTGKEMVARALHRRGARAKGPFCAINCGALPDALLESELFGHVRGAFTDARFDRRGLVFEADKGTLFLDEIGDCSAAFQVKLLRVLEERRARPVGGASELPFDARLVTATHKDLESEVAEGRFREDLYFRVHVIQVHLPPLRERGADVLLLAQHFLEQFAARTGRGVLALSDVVAQKLLAYDWPGNVRELRNAMERAVAVGRDVRIQVEDLPDKIRAYEADQVVFDATDAARLVPMEDVEKRYIATVLKSVAGNKTQAARILGFDRKTLYRKLERYGIGDGAE